MSPRGVSTDSYKIVQARKKHDFFVKYSRQIVLSTIKKELSFYGSQLHEVIQGTGTRFRI